MSLLSAFANFFASSLEISRSVGIIKIIIKDYHYKNRTKTKKVKPGALLLLVLYIKASILHASKKCFLKTIETASTKGILKELRRTIIQTAPQAEELIS